MSASAPTYIGGLKIGIARTGSHGLRWCNGLRPHTLGEHGTVAGKTGFHKGVVFAQMGGWWVVYGLQCTGQSGIYVIVMVY